VNHTIETAAGNLPLLIVGIVALVLFTLFMTTARAGTHRYGIQIKDKKERRSLTLVGLMGVGLIAAGVLVPGLEPLMRGMMIAFGMMQMVFLTYL
jgi:hypothetical protein